MLPALAGANAAGDIVVSPTQAVAFLNVVRRGHRSHFILIQNSGAGDFNSFYLEGVKDSPARIFAAAAKR